MDINKYMVSLIENLKNLVRIKTVEDTPVPGGPFGIGNKKCLEEMLRICDSLGFKTKNLDGYCGYAEIGSGDEVVGIVSHLDVVPEGEGWDYPPYSATIVDGYMYGRGTWDDKGPAIISVYAIKALMDEGYKFNKRVRLIFGCQEETGNRCMEHYKEVEGMFDYGVSPDSSFPVIFAERTITNHEIKGTSKENGKVKLISLNAGVVINAVPDKCEFVIKGASLADLETLENSYKKDNILFARNSNGETTSYIVFGKASHGSVPWEGINAASFAIKGLALITDSDFVKMYSKCIGTDVNGKNLGYYGKDKYGEMASNVGLVSYDGTNFSIKINSRLTSDIDAPKVLANMKESLRPFSFVNVYELSVSEGFMIDENSKMIKGLVKAYADITGDTSAKAICTGGGTYARHFKNCVAFGPETDKYGSCIIHQPNERISLVAIEEILKIYYQAYRYLIEEISFK